MKAVQLTQGKVALVDDDDYDRVNAFRWHAAPAKSGDYYATRDLRDLHGSRKKIRMHRFIMNVSTEDRNVEVDHWDHNTLNNQKSNLRPTDKSHNLQNRHHSRNTSGYKGVTFHKGIGKWQASIKKDCKQYYLGVYDNPESAANAYNDAARLMYADGARLNSISVARFERG